MQVHVMWVLVLIFAGVAAFLGGYMLGARNARRELHRAIRTLDSSGTTDLSTH